MSDEFKRERLFAKYGSLHDAISRRDNRTVAALLRELPELAGYRDPELDGPSPLFHALATRNLDALRLLLEAGADVDERGEEKQATLLHWAARNALEAEARLLLRSGAEVDARELTGQTPLHWAASKGHNSVIQTLLAFDATIDSRDSGKRTPLQFAIEQGRVETVRLLVEMGADVDAADMFGSSPRRDGQGKPAIMAIIEQAST